MASDHQQIEPCRLERAAAGLRPLEREALRLGADGGLSPEEIAGRLGISVDEVPPLTARALVMLERALARQERSWWRLW